MKILFVGDVMLGRGVNAILKDKPSSYPWGNTLDIIHDADLRICNLECVISDIGGPWPDKTFNFRTDSKNVEVLKAARFSPISIANNHTLDFGIEALDHHEGLLARRLFEEIPCGAKSGRRLKLDGKQLEEILEKGAIVAIKG